MFKYNDFIGCTESNRTLHWSGTDSKENYLKNLKKVSDDWYYKDRIINYTYNSTGHRSKELDDLDHENCILFFGDSHTEGIGLEVETTYPYLVSKDLGLDYYNFGLGGSGIDVLFYNLNVYLMKYPKPKYISIYYSDNTRFVIKVDDAYKLCGLWRDDNDVTNFVRYGDSTGYFVTKTELFINLIELQMKTKQIKHSNITLLDYDLPCKVRRYGMAEYDLARDLAHGGRILHRKIADDIIKDYYKQS